MQDAKEARQICADVMFIEGKFFDGLGGGLEQSRVSHALVFSDEAAQFFWDREGEQEMVSGELALELFLKPLSSLMVLASRAMAIATGAIEFMGPTAGFALVEGQAAGFGTAADDGIDDLAVCFRHAVGVAFEVLGGEGAKDLIDGGHG